MRLTAAGKAFLPEARATVLAAQRAERAAREALSLRTGQLEIATVRSVAVGILPPAIRTLIPLNTMWLRFRAATSTSERRRWWPAGGRGGGCSSSSSSSRFHRAL